MDDFHEISWGKIAQKILGILLSNDCNYFHTQWLKKQQIGNLFAATSILKVASFQNSFDGTVFLLILHYW